MYEYIGCRLKVICNQYIHFILSQTTKSGVIYSKLGQNFLIELLPYLSPRSRTIRIRLQRYIAQIKYLQHYVEPVFYIRFSSFNL